MKYFGKKYIFKIFWHITPFLSPPKVLLAIIKLKRIVLFYFNGSSRCKWHFLPKLFFAPSCQMKRAPFTLQHLSQLLFHNWKIENNKNKNKKNSVKMKIHNLFSEYIIGLYLFLLAPFTFYRNVCNITLSLTGVTK